MRLALKWLPLALAAVGVAVWLAVFGGDGELPAGKVLLGWLAVGVLVVGSVVGVVYDRKADR